MEKKAITISVITAIILTLIGGGVFWYLTKTNNNLEQATNNPPQENQPENNNEPVTNNNVVEENIDTSDWLTYRNEEYGFEFRYPNFLKINSKKSNNINVVHLCLEMKKC